MSDETVMERAAAMADALDDGSWRSWTQEQAHEVEEAFDALHARVAELEARLAPGRCEWCHTSEDPEVEGLRARVAELELGLANFTIAALVQIIADCWDDSPECGPNGMVREWPDLGLRLIVQRIDGEPLTGVIEGLRARLVLAGRLLDLAPACSRHLYCVGTCAKCQLRAEWDRGEM